MLSKSGSRHDQIVRPCLEWPRSTSSTQTSNASSLPPVHTRYAFKSPSLSLQRPISTEAFRLFNTKYPSTSGEGFHFPAPTPAPAFSPSISPRTILQAIPALRPKLSLDCSKLLPFSFSSRLILTKAAAQPTETAKIGSRVLFWKMRHQNECSFGRVDGSL